MTSSLAELDDRSLTTLALRGGPESFTILMDRHLGAIRNHIRSMLRNEADLEDLLQEIVFKIWRHLSSFRWESSFRTWITQVAVNEVRQPWRRAKRRQECETCGDVPDTTSAYDSPHQAFTRAQAVDALRNAVMELPASYQTVVILHDLEGFSLEEIALRLQTTVQAVKSRRFRARRLLVAALHRPAPGTGCRL